MSNRSLCFLVAAALIALPITACRDGPAVTGPELRPASSLAQGANAVSVMTQNLYHGANVNAIAQVPGSQVPIAAAAAWAAIQATDFPTRAQALAEEIAATRPHLIGLQEVTTWRTQTPSDFVQGNFAPNATDVGYDFLPILLDALAARGLDYRVAAVTETSDIEVPAFTGVGPIPYMDLRYGDADAVLVRSDVNVLQSFTQQYAARLTLVVGGLPVVRKHGLAAARVSVGRHELTFVSTHLIGEESADIQIQQAAELIAWAGAQAVPVMIVGDFNSAANPGAAPGRRTDTYGMLLHAGFTDVWDRGRKPESGLTCCHNELLSNVSAAFDQRLDLVLLNQGFDRMVGAAQARVVGADFAVHATYGLWPSNHAGVFAVLHMPMQ